MSPLRLEKTEKEYDWGRVLEITPIDTIEDLKNPKGPVGPELRQMAHQSMHDVTGAFLNSTTLENKVEKTLVLGIPRGGFPPGAGTYDAVKQSQTEAALVYTNAGEGRNLSVGKIPVSLPENTRSILISDGVVGSGGETIAHLEAIFEHLPEDQIQMIGFLSIAAATYGLENIARHMGEVHPKLKYQMATMQVYDKTGDNAYVGWRTVGDRNVFFVGVGDYGSRVQGDLTTQELYALYAKQPVVRRS